jgi:DDE superfamily endonuclease
MVFHNGNFLVGDKAYPLSEFLLPPFKRYEGQQADERLYNYLHSSTRMIVENAFGKLKARFRRLKTNLFFKSIEADCVAGLAACILHNVCELNNDCMKRAKRDHQCFNNGGTNNRACYGNTTSAQTKRCRLCDYLAAFDVL